MRIYTKTGDNGQTGLLGAERVSKDAPRIQAYGTIDECNAAIGVARAASCGGKLDAMLEEVQDQLFTVGAELANPAGTGNLPTVTEVEIRFLENAIDTLEATLPPLKTFILPGGSPAAAHLHLARAICRRAERLIVALQSASETTGAHILPYVNRLSDFLFVAARAENARAGTADRPWRKPPD